MYVYEDHLGVLYVSEELLDYEDTYCEACNDSDWLIGYASTNESAWDMLEENIDIDIDGSGGFDYEYVKEFIDKHWKQ